MIVDRLVRTLEDSHNPLAVRATTWALEKVTGIKTSELMEFKGSEGPAIGFNTTNAGDWYQRNGFYRLAGLTNGSYSNAGVQITPDVALTNPAIYAGVKVISEDMGMLPLFLYERRGPNFDQIEKYRAHPLYRALHDLPNQEIGAGEFVQMLTAHACLGLDGYAQIVRNSRTISLYPWMPGDVTTDRDNRKQLVYIHKEGNEPAKTFPREQVFHLRGWTLDGKQSDPILVRARDAIGLGVVSQTYAANFFKQDASPGVIISFPLLPGNKERDADQVRRIKEAWKSWHQGESRRHEPAVLQGGATVTRNDPDHQKLQLIEQRKFAVIEACRVLRLSPHKLADLERATFSNIEHLQIEHITQTLGPWIGRWREAVYRCLLTFDEQQAGRIYAEHEVSKLLQGAFEQQSEGFRKMLEKGVYSINEVRRLLNLNPIRGGADHFIQLNLATVQDVASGATLPVPAASGSTV